MSLTRKSNTRKNDFDDYSDVYFTSITYLTTRSTLIVINLYEIATDFSDSDCFKFYNVIGTLLVYKYNFGVFIREERRRSWLAAVLCCELYRNFNTTSSICNFDRNPEAEAFRKKFDIPRYPNQMNRISIKCK